MSDATVALYLTVTKPGAYYPSGESTLYTRQVPMHHTPGEGDLIELWDVDGEGPTWYIHRRYWDSHGKLTLDLAAMLLDPPDGQSRSVSQSYYSQNWLTDRDGDPRERLEAAGWTKYRS